MRFDVMTGRTVNLTWWSHSKTVALIWLISAFFFYTLFQMALRNSSETLSSNSSDSPNLNTEQRSKLYDKMARDLDEHGAAFMKHGETSQSLTISDIFTVKDGYVTPVLKAANPPVRANILYLSTEFSVPIAEAVKSIFSPHFEKAIWFQNSTMYHFSMFHASHHIVPVPASKEEIEVEASSVKAVAAMLCPLKIVLDRVVLTSTGVLLGCWQYDASILHTTFARLLGPSSTKAVVSELWYVEEYDVLALALNGRMNVRKFKLGCSRD
ncbi:uncharacterized protein LOC130740330 isoform X6 [Lotus japonicus]|uniref:uncharacterized protein LOC130740330 isoform X6 n=1 Tax=Lotus japonicus TaxID=34305 RepID=UPI002583EB23|nr:uncharacterized protein LOC130740330 isoform X6 [Lotus japonicus]